MTSQDLPAPDAIRKRMADAIAAHWKLFLVQGVILVVLGLLAVAMPLISTLAIELLIGWLFLVGGALRLATLFRARHLPGYWWSIATAVAAVALGLILIANPLRGVLTLTMVLMALFLIEGVAAILAALNFRQHSRNWGWLLFSGIVDLVLVYLIWQGWPATAAWAIGLLAGVNLLFTGLSLVMLAIAARQAGAGR